MYGFGIRVQWELVIIVKVALWAHRAKKWLQISSMIHVKLLSLIHKKKKKTSDKGTAIQYQNKIVLRILRRDFTISFWPSPNVRSIANFFSRKS